MQCGNSFCLNRTYWCLWVCSLFYCT